MQSAVERDDSWYLGEDGGQGWAVRAEERRAAGREEVGGPAGSLEILRLLLRPGSVTEG